MPTVREPCRGRRRGRVGSSRGGEDWRAARDAVIAYVRGRKLPFPVWLDPHDRAAAAFGATTSPLNVLIDRDGIIRWRREGAVTADEPELRTALDAALAGTR